MNTLQITATYPPSVNGVAIAVSNLKDSLIRNRIGAIVLAPDNPHQPKLVRRVGGREAGVYRYPSLPNHFAPEYPIPLVPDLKTITKLLNGSKPDLVHVHHPFHVGGFARLIAKFFNTPLVFTYHTRYDQYALHYFNFLPDKLKTTYIQNTVDKFCKKADLVISPATNITNTLLNRVPSVNIVTIPSGLPPITKTRTTKTKLRQKLNLPQDKTILLLVSRLSQEKNLPLLIKSLKKLDSKFLLVMVGDGNYKPDLLQLVKKNHLDQKVKFIGQIDHHNLGSYYSAADIFVYPSITETQGLIFLEALSFSLPIVAVKSAASSQWVPPNLGILTKNNPTSFAQGIRMVKSKPNADFYLQAKTFVKKFSIAKTTAQIIKQYKQLIDLKNLLNSPINAQR